jgi:fumarate hydratase class I
MDVKRITTPLAPKVVADLRVGDAVSLSGTIVTGRDQVHKHLAAGARPPISLEGLVIYHCGPVAVDEGGRWKITAAGPTTSMREEPYEAQIISGLRPGAIMGKGGMGEKTLHAMSAYPCVYLHATGGAAQYYAQRIVRVEGVYFEEFGQPEALWVLTVKDLRALVTMDANGGSLHRGILSESSRRFQELLAHPYEKNSQT